MVHLQFQKVIREEKETSRILGKRKITLSLTSVKNGPRYLGT